MDEYTTTFRALNAEGSLRVTVVRSKRHYRYHTIVISKLYGRQGELVCAGNHGDEAVRLINKCGYGLTKSLLIPQDHGDYKFIISVPAFSERNAKMFMDGILDTLKRNDLIIAPQKAGVS